MRRWVAVLVLAVVAVPALGQATDFKALFAGGNFPVTLKLGDLTPDWRRFTTSGSGDMSGLMSVYAAMFGGGSVSPYYTRGDTVTIGSETYLVAYKSPSKPMDMAAMMRGGPSAAPAPEKLKPESTLALSLLNVKSMGSLNDIRPFNLGQEIAESDTAASAAEALRHGGDTAEAASSDSNLKQLALGMLMYCQDYDEVLPPMKDAATVKKAIMPYVKNEGIFLQPDTKKPYQPNTVLSHKKMKHLSSPASMVVFYEESPGPDGKRGVAYLDGHVARVPENDWAQVKRASKIP